ncbi:MAG: hypothetical protein A2745_02185 [Candidatus Harrisonbacteria bacterium RIFCSPHIGHO2_01_FULL_44_13]|nr:MAG: hypothetical protein A3D60_00100 [Candidatus Uhrbacteria bacterium RIFCSPHIGHO2_02_FULL_47_29]OGY62956.1 MAG: hypothetical protein A2745_02185 [Candidatus Harrisonbacteria bacterium RIFCSPHIGHO2_01_FULL_44_13]
MINFLKNRKAPAVVVFIMCAAVGAAAYLFITRDSFACHADEGAVVRVWAPAYMEMGPFVGNILAPAVTKRCGYNLEFNESEIDYREAARDISAVLAENPGNDLLMLDESLVRDLADEGIIAEPDAVLFSIKEETGLDFFGIAMVDAKIISAASDDSGTTDPRPASLIPSWLIKSGFAQTPGELLVEGLKAARNVIDISQMDGEKVMTKIAEEELKRRATELGEKELGKFIEKQAAQRLEKRVLQKTITREAAEKIAEKFGATVAKKVFTKLNVALSVIDGAKDVYDIVKESYELDSALSNLEESLRMNIETARKRIGNAGDEALGLAMALFNCETDPDGAEARLRILEDQVRRDRDFVNELAAEIHRTTGSQAEANRQMRLNDEILKYFGAAAEAAMEAIGARRAMGDECSLISIKPDPVDFDDVCIRKTKDIAVYAKNFHKTEIRLRETNLNEWPRAPLFYVEGQRGNFALPPGKTHGYAIQFLPQQEKIDEATLSLIAELKVFGIKLIETRNVPVKGRGIYCQEEKVRDTMPKLSFNPDPVDFGEICIGDSKTVGVRAENTGNYDLRIGPYGRPGSPFSVVSPLSDMPRLLKGDALDFSIKYVASPGYEEDAFSIYSNALNDYGDEILPMAPKVKLSGRGIDCSAGNDGGAQVAPGSESATPVPESAANKCETICGQGRVKAASSLAACSDTSQEFLCIQNKKACYNYLVPAGWQNDSGCCCIDPYIEAPASERIDCSKFSGWDANGYAVTKNVKYPADSATLPPEECK